MRSGNWPSVSLSSIGIFAGCLIGATLLHWVRVRNGRATGRGQWFNDGTGVGTLIVLVLLVIGTAARADWAADLVRENAALMLWALLYSAVMIGSNLLDSCKAVEEGG